MLVLSEVTQKDSNVKNFNAHEYINSLNLSGKFTISPNAKISFKKGWAYLIEEFMKAIKSYPIKIREISDDYSQLNIEFELVGKTPEVRIWRAIDSAIKTSRDTCIDCGGIGRTRIHGEKVLVICRECLHNLESSGDTGTWLDKF